MTPPEPQTPTTEAGRDLVKRVYRARTLWGDNAANRNILTDLVREKVAKAEAQAAAAERRRVLVARFVAEHWRDEYMKGVRSGDSQYAIGTHPLHLVINALDGETDPRQLGLPESLDADLAAILDELTETDR